MNRFLVFFLAIVLAFSRVDSFATPSSYLIKAAPTRSSPLLAKPADKASANGFWEGDWICAVTFISVYEEPINLIIRN